MEQFSLEKYLENPSRKVVTRDGREVDIYYSPTSRIPLIGRTSDNYIYQYTKNGFQCDIMNQAKNDLFFAYEKEELTEFEKYVRNILGRYISNIDDFPETIKNEAKSLLDLARKEIRKEEQEKLGTLEMPIDPLNPHYQKGREDALKDLPKLEKTKDVINPTIPVMYTYAATNKTYVEYDGHKLCINDAFEKLPKEE